MFEDTKAKQEIFGLNRFFNPPMINLILFIEQDILFQHLYLVLWRPVIINFFVTFFPDLVAENTVAPKPFFNFFDKTDDTAIFKEVSCPGRYDCLELRHLPFEFIMRHHGCSENHRVNGRKSHIAGCYAKIGIIYEFCIRHLVIASPIEPDGAVYTQLFSFSFESLSFGAIADEGDIEKNTSLLQYTDSLEQYFKFLDFCQTTDENKVGIIVFVMLLINIGRSLRVSGDLQSNAVTE